MIEYFDVVDNTDIPTGEKTTKSEAHTEYIIHRCVAVFLFDKSDNLYVQHHKESGMFDHTVGGHVSEGEEYLTAALREAEEEIGLIDHNFQEVSLGLASDEVFNPDKQEGRRFHMFGIYECVADESWNFVPNSEVEELSLIPLEDLVAGMQANPTFYTPGFINTMAEFLKVRRPEIVFDHNLCRENWGK